MQTFEENDIIDKNESWKVNNEDDLTWVYLYASGNDSGNVTIERSNSKIKLYKPSFDADNKVDNSKAIVILGDNDSENYDIEDFDADIYGWCLIEGYEAGITELEISFDGEDDRAKITVCGGNLATDINNDGVIDEHDDELEESGLGEIIRVNNSFEPAGVEDDLQKIIINAKESSVGKSWLEYDSNKIKVWKDINRSILLQSASSSNPNWRFDDGDEIPNQIYVEGIATTPKNNSIELKFCFKWLNWEINDKIKLTITDKPGHYAYFRGIKDYLEENDFEVFIDRINLPGGFSSRDDFQLAAVNANSMNMTIYDAKANDKKNIISVIEANSDATMIINGTFFSFRGIFSPFGTKTHGTVVNNNEEIINISKTVPFNLKPTYKGYFAQCNNDNYMWKRNVEAKDEITTENLNAALSGLAAFVPKKTDETYADIMNQIDVPHSDQYKSALAHIGYANENNENILFILFINHPEAPDFPENIDRAPLFESLVNSGCLFCYGLDGSGSIGVAYKRPGGDLIRVVKGSKHLRESHWLVNNYIIIKSKE